MDDLAVPSVPDDHNPTGKTVRAAYRSDRACRGESRAVRTERHREHVRPEGRFLSAVKDWVDFKQHHSIGNGADRDLAPIVDRCKLEVPGERDNRSAVSLAGDLRQRTGLAPADRIPQTNCPIVAGRRQNTPVRGPR